MSEEVLSKEGPDLFKELLRIYETADPEDYVRAGQWRNDLMRTDVALIEAHRKEGGAPDPPDLADVVLPQMLVVSGAGPALKLGLAPTGTSAPVGVPGAAAGGGAVAELRLIALFVSKWKLDPTKTKLMLSKLSPVRRRYVMKEFTTKNSGAEATNELHVFVAECEKSGAWDKGGDSGLVVAPPAPYVVKPTTTVAPTGVAPPLKRPLVVSPSGIDHSKRPRLGAPVLVAPTATNGANARLAAARAAVISPAARPGIVRPVIARPPTVQPRAVAPPAFRAAGVAARPPASIVRPLSPRPGGGVIRSLLGR